MGRRGIVDRPTRTVETGANIELGMEHHIDDEWNE